MEAGEGGETRVVEERSADSDKEGRADVCRLTSGWVGWVKRGGYWRIML